MALPMCTLTQCTSDDDVSRRKLKKKIKTKKAAKIFLIGKASGRLSAKTPEIAYPISFRIGSRPITFPQFHPPSLHSNQRERKEKAGVQRAPNRNRNAI
jgi:hypothetical protein